MLQLCCSYAAAKVQQNPSRKRTRKRAPTFADALIDPLPDQVFIDSKNSELFLVLRSLSSKKSIASMVPIGLRIRRSTYIFLSSCGSVISSSLRVAEREVSLRGN